MDNFKIIADDLGLHESVNDGIIFLLKESKINGASLMANGKTFDHAVRKCSEVQLPNIGIHLVLVEEKPVSKVSEVRSLVDKNGFLHRNHRKFFIRYILKLINKNEIDMEMRAQVVKCIQAGIKPTFINSHQHLHLLPGVTDMVIKLAKEFNIPYIRIVNEPISLGRGKLFRQAQLLLLNFLSKLAKNKIRKAGLECNNFFIGFINAGNLSRRDIGQAQKLSSKHPDKIIELGSHPGYQNQNLMEKYGHWGYHNWQKELEVLKNNRQ